MDEGTITKLTNYLHASRPDPQNPGCGLIDVAYKQSNGGRYSAVGGVGIQFMVREVKDIIASEQYIDIDMVNAHPVILQHLCKLFRYSDNENEFKTPNLDYYIDNRDALLSKYGPEFKQAVISCINGGKKNMAAMINKFSDDIYLRNFKSECKRIREVFIADDPAGYNAVVQENSLIAIYIK